MSKSARCQRHRTMIDGKAHHLPMKRCPRCLREVIERQGKMYHEAIEWHATIVSRLQGGLVKASMAIDEALSGATPAKKGKARIPPTG